jgi:hypothetical protein
MSVLASGVRLNNRFTIRDLIGTGGMSQVWRADDAVLGRVVAVKVLTAALVTDPSLRTTTWAEARAAAQLTHPHVTQVYDYGETTLSGGVVLPYLVMELVDGQSLADRLRSGPLPWQQAIIIASQVASALAAAHRIGVVHRDVKPANVILTRTGAKILDFGIAALADGQPDAARGRLIGTPAYAAPERVRSDPPIPASDVYALGVLLYESLIGRPPTAVTTWRQAAEAHHAGATIAPPDVPGLPRQVRRLCMACLSPDPAGRPTAGDLEHGLATAGGQPPATTTVMPTVISEPPPVVPGPQTGFAVGSTPLPHPPTVIDPGTSAAGDLNAGLARPRRLPRPLLAMLVAAAVILVAAVFVVTSTLLSGGVKQAAQPAASPSTGLTTAAAQPATAPSAASSSPVPTATTARAIADELDTAIASALAAGRIGNDAAKGLRDKVKNLRKSIGTAKVDEKVQELQERINELLADGKVDRQTADRLIALLQPLTGTG